eukprot:CAMPEP_0205901142 /NCGR_PEP_ID=MMETSP1083-20121108/27520_1 /ASSEMBLY_ACC=CAM_ASM_000430 /TAXON_ID=97485 /ORGANISM="Prymnesium parvum, Strain Texoma1" /LENGTH=180 /DNA_ID=CAMNT_0053266643 /DNA_START=51 /DNA_END=591 /DNA_ORIENTATION=+
MTFSESCIACLDESHRPISEARRPMLSQAQFSILGHPPTSSIALLQRPKLPRDGRVALLHAAHVRDDQREQLIVQLRMLLHHIALLERVLLQVVQLPPVAEGGVARDGVVRHVALPLEPVAHVSVGGEVALPPVDLLVVQVAARAVRRLLAPVGAVVDDEQLPLAAHHRAAVADLHEEGP